MIRLLALLCCLLLAAIAGEMLVPDDRVADGAVTVAPRAAANPPAPLGNPPAALRSQWVTEVLARPLFSPSRRPAPGTAISSNEASLPRLAGVIGTPEGAVAIFQPVGDAKPVLVHGGDRLGAWEVTRIDSGAVYLERGGDRLVINPHFSSAPPPGAPALGLPAPPAAPLRR